ncbi:MAG: RagB/SusD family nutrient uptake outer membrane protein [Muribaculaceae bacterium]|nr:RagB/SusD family nutrient uptake outer membrane protein [Muribaculaceae bacterium]
MKKHILTIALGSIAMMMSSCLDLEPKDQLSDANLWDKPGDFASFANQMYGWTNSFNEIVYSAGPHGDKRSDILLDKGGYNIYSNGQQTVPAGSSLTAGNYASFYSHIRYCNILIERAKDYSGNINDIRQPLGEAYFFRAYTYYELLTIFGDAIIVDHVIDTDDPAMYAKRDDRLEVAQFIISDLHNAAEYLKSKSELEDGRVSEEAALAFLSRAALYEASWQKFHKNNLTAANELYTEAADAAKTVIDGGKFQLFYNGVLGTESYRYLFILEDVQCNPASLTKSANHEFIFSRCYNIDNPSGQNLTKETLANAQLVTRKFFDMFLCQDGLPIELSNKYDGSGETMVGEWKNRDNRISNMLLMPGTSYWDNTNHSRLTFDDADLGRAFTNFEPGSSGTGYYTRKYAAERQVEDRKESYDYPIIRYAEVLLNYAEALYERDGKISDEDLAISINKTRKRVNPEMPDLTNAFVSGNGLDMRTEIRRERTIELFNEGFRIDDLKRWKTAEVEMPMDLCGITFTGEYARSEKWAQNALPLNEKNQVVYESGRSFQQKNYLYPLPSDQMQLNPNLGQNPGW